MFPLSFFPKDWLHGHFFGIVGADSLDKNVPRFRFDGIYLPLRLCNLIITSLLFLLSAHTWSPEAEAIQRFFPDVPLMAAISQCESGMSHFTKGKVTPHLNKNGTTDYGVMQINSSNFPLAKKVGLDPMDLEENVQFARYLYDHGGIAHWNATLPCAKEKMRKLIILLPVSDG